VLGGNTFVGSKEPLGIEQTASFKNKTIKPLDEKNTARDDADSWGVMFLSLVPEPPTKGRRNGRDRTADGCDRGW
jgi:hypothetical protein